MTNFVRKFLEEFAKDNKSTDLGVFGSAASGSPAISSDPEVLQSNSKYKEGWAGATLFNTGNFTRNPVQNEMSALAYIANYQISYLLQNGIPEFNAPFTEYFIGNITRTVGGTKLYRSAINNNINLDINAAAYDVGTTYAEDDVAADTNGDIYRSLSDGNIGNALSNPTFWELVWEFLIDLSDIGTAASKDTGIIDGTVPLIETGDKLNSDIENNQADLLATAVASASTSIQFSASIDTSKYSDFVIQISGMRPTTNATELLLRMNSLSGASDYRYVMSGRDDSASNVNDQDSADDAIVLTDGAILSNVADRPFNTTIKFFALDSTTFFKLIRAEIAHITSANNLSTTQLAGAFIANTSVITDIEFLISAGTIAEGTFSLYGIRK